MWALHLFVGICLLLVEGVANVLLKGNAAVGRVFLGEHVSSFLLKGTPATTRHNLATHNVHFKNSWS